MVYSLTFRGGDSLTLHEIDEASSIAKEAADPQANIIVGQVINPKAGEEIVVTVIATGFEKDDVLQHSDVRESSRISIQPAHEPVLATVGKDGEYPNDALDRPTVMRQYEPSRQNHDKGGVLVDDDWDVPTFLRKQTE